MMLRIEGTMIKSDKPAMIHQVDVQTASNLSTRKWRYSYNISDLAPRDVVAVTGYVQFVYAMLDRHGDGDLARPRLDRPLECTLHKRIRTPFPWTYDVSPSSFVPARSKWWTSVTYQASQTCRTGTAVVKPYLIGMAIYNSQVIPSSIGRTINRIVMEMVLRA